MDKVKFLIKCLIVLAMVFVFNYCFVADINSYTRVMMDELYEDGYIDVLFLGASHTYRTFDPEVIEEETRLNVFNAGSSSQSLQGSYYLLKDACEKNGVGTVVFDVTYHMLGVEAPDKTATYIIADYMKGIKNKCQYLWDAYGSEGVVNGVFPFLHSVSFSPSTLIEHIKREYVWNPYSYITYDNEAYQGQGFVYSYEVVSEEYEFLPRYMIDQENLLSDFAEEYLYKIIAYCKGNDVELILVNPPMADGTLMGTGCFQVFVDRMSLIAEEEGLEYWDLNLVREGVLTMARTDYKDEGHLNGAGAEKVSRCISRLIRGDIEDPFYVSFEEKVRCNPDGTWKGMSVGSGR